MFNFKPTKVAPMFNSKVSKPMRPRPMFTLKVATPKRDMNWKQSKKVYPNLKPFGDADKDGVRNKFDCKPFNRMKQGPKHKKGRIGEMLEDFRVDGKGWDRKGNAKATAISIVDRIKALEDKPKTIIDDNFTRSEQKRHEARWAEKYRRQKVEEFNNNKVAMAEKRKEHEVRRDKLRADMKKHEDTATPWSDETDYQELDYHRKEIDALSPKKDTDYVFSPGSDLSDADIEDIMDSDEDPSKYF